MKTQALLKQGRSRLEAAPDAVRKTACNVVRFYYLSEGGEMLCVDSGPLTFAAAQALRSNYRVGLNTAAVKVEILHTFYGRAGDNARLVILPSQMEAK